VNNQKAAGGILLTLEKPTKAMRGERVLQVVFGGVEGKVSDKLTPSTACFRTSGLKT